MSVNGAVGTSAAAPAWLVGIDLGTTNTVLACAAPGSQQVDTFANGRTRWDTIVWYLLLLPILLAGWPFVITAPVALYLAIAKRKSLPSHVVRSRLRLTLAIPVAVVEIAAFAALVFMVVRN